MRRTFTGLMVVAAGAVVGGVEARASTADVAGRSGMERPLEVVRSSEAGVLAVRTAAERRRETIDALFAKLKTAKPSASPSLSSVAVLPQVALTREGNPETREETSAKPSASHVVQPGETLAAIARRYYGHAGAWETIAAANGIADPSAVTSGRRLTIPASETPVPSGPEVVPAPAAPASSAPAAPRVRPVLITDRAPVLDRNRAPSEQSLDYATYEWRVYHVQPGETLSSLAEKFLGGAAQAGVLARFNQIGEGSVLPAGSGLLVPQPKRPELHERYLLSTQGIFR